MSRASIEDLYPLSPLQQGMLFLSLLAPESDVYLRQVSYQVDIPLDVAAFEQAWQTVVDRHPALRTCFVWERQKEPHQVVLKRLKVPFEHHDLRGLAQAEQEGRSAALFAAERRRPVQLSRPPLLRVTLLELAADRFRCALTYHHILVDGWSLGRILGEVATVYQSLFSGRQVALPPARPFADYIAWVRRQDMAATESFFRGYLRGLLAPTRVWAAPGPPPPALAERFAELAARLPADVTARLRGVLSGHGLTPATLVHGLWALLLSRYTGERDVIHGAVFSGRPESLPDSDSIVGLLVNTLPLRARVEPAGRSLAWLARLQSERLDLHRFEFAPLARVQQWSEVGGGHPLFDSLVIFENFPRGAAGGVPVSDVRTFEATHYPSTLLAEVTSEIVLRLAFDASLCPPAEACRLLARFEALLRGLAERPEGLLGELSPLAPGERQQALVEWNDTYVPASAAPSALAGFERQVARQPDATAVECGAERLSYGELDRRAGLLAARLAAVGVGPETLVGLAVEVAVEQVVALFAVWKAGGAYVPLDPGYPRERLAFMMEDAALPVVLTEETLLDRLPRLPRSSARFVLLDRPSANAVPAAAVVPVAPAALAYALYTSGSTGRPKGVLVSHANLANFLAAMGERPGFGAGRRLLAVTSLSFDIAGLEIYLPLICGGVVVLAPREVAQNGVRLRAALAEQGIDVLQATPATWQLLVEGDWRELGGLTALSGGEALPGPLAERIAAGAAALWNLYGPTETTVWSAIQLVGEPCGGAVPLGRPIASTSIHCLDRELAPVPIGAPGELVIGGAGVARGYLGRPGLTAERFVPDPWSATPGGRLYRTGDLARFSPAGRLEFLGRFDHQVKVRGVRIELQEIEAVLVKCPGVREAAVAMREMGPGDLRLVAYLTAEPGAALVPQEIRAQARRLLPEAMVPSSLVVLPAGPRGNAGSAGDAGAPEPRVRRLGGRRAAVGPGADDRSGVGRGAATGAGGGG
jgi:amino acid adenylation domain-containing protein